MKAKRKIISALLVVMVVAGFMPQACFAASPQDNGKAIQLGTDGISGYNGGYDYIYFGNWNAPDEYTTSGPIKWRVLDTKTNMKDAQEGDGLFLLSEALYGSGYDGGVVFSESYSNAWQGSNAQAWCKEFYDNSISKAEKGAVLSTTKSDGEYFVYIDPSNPDGPWLTVYFAASDNILNKDKVFFLSVEEVKNYDYGLEYSLYGKYGDTSWSGDWWLRSPVRDQGGLAGKINFNARDVESGSVSIGYKARPALNLDSSTVLFSSAATGGKSAGGMETGLAAVSGYDGTEWKLTLLDSSRQLKISGVTTNTNGDTIAFSYADAKTGANEYLSAAIVENGAITHYGRILHLDGTTNGTSGQARLTLPAGVTLNKTTKLMVFNEQYNGGASDDTKLTDTSSVMIEVQPTVDTTAPTLTAGTATRESDTAATVTFTPDEAGSCYYAVVESGATAPSIVTTGTGTPCDATEQTISLTNLTGNDAKDLYIVVKDVAGNVSIPLKMEIPAYIPPVHSIAADSSALTFESATEGYQAAPAAQTVTITNTGNQEVTLTQPTATNFNIGTLSATELAAGETATFTVQPKDGLAVGAHNETLTISGSDNVSASVALSFEVTARPVPPVTPPSKPTYPPTVPEAEGGDVSVGPARPNEGDTVTVTPKPKEGMVVDKIIVTDKDGNKIEVTQKPNGDFTFEQPNGKVTITVTFKPEGEEGPSGDLPFADVPQGAWYEEAVQYVYEHGLIMGVSANEFAPNMTTTRGQLVTMLWRLAGEPQAENSTGFGDVPSNAYYAKAVAWAAENGITAGFEDGTFRPTTGLSREQMAALFMKVAAHSGIDTTARADISGFTDVKPESWSYNALSWAKAVGLLNGVADTAMAPQDTATRAQIAAVLQRYCETVAK